MTRSMFKMMVAAAAGLAMVPAAATAQHQHSDILLEVIDGRIVTGEEHGGAFEAHRVFGAEFGELFPNWTDEPGFDSAAGVFVPGQGIGFDIVRAVRVWDGEAFVEVPEERIRVAAQGEHVDSPLTDVMTPGLAIGVARATGRFHEHATFELLAPAAAGIYLLDLQLWADGGDPARSDTFWIVFNQESPEPEHDEAIEWVERVLAGCRADVDGDGDLTFFDFLAFQDRFAAGDPLADFDGDGDLTFFDFLAFQQAFAEGCD